MPLLLRNIVLNPGDDEGTLLRTVASRYGLSPGELSGFSVVRKGIDARKKPRIKIVYTVRFSLSNEAAFLVRHGNDRDMEAVPEEMPPGFPPLTATGRIVIVGAGPAGLFAALRLSDYGLAPLLLERGKPVADRLRDVQAFWGKGILDPESNVQFGEGGAGTFSDGKLTTRVRDPNIAYVLERLVQFGAPDEIRYLARPHIGTDRLRRVITDLRLHLESRGTVFGFRRRLTGLESGPAGIRGIVVNDREEEPCNALILAPGHSARDTYGMLHRHGVHLERKPFAVGVRVEHPQELIDRIQYGRSPHPALPPADYALAHNDPGSGRSVYSFCMCPGGVVVAGSSEAEGVVTNGMSNHLRNSPYANSALVVTVGNRDFHGESPLAGIEFQRRYERAAFDAGGGGYRAPAQNLLSFLTGSGSGPIGSTYRPGVREAELASLLPSGTVPVLREGLRAFDRKMRGFVTAEAVLTGLETRTSAPVRIVRGEDCQSVSLPGLYPAGEGAGYAGGIMSAALDGIRVADVVAARFGMERTYQEHEE